MRIEVDVSVSSEAGRIFQDIPDEIDASWVHGILVGGMASVPDDLYVAQSYMEAAGELVDQALESQEAWRFSYPILYLYRHALELRLKSIVKLKRQNHQLRPLIGVLEIQLFTRLGRVMPDRLKHDLLIFSDIDPDAQGFRYSHTVKGEARLLIGEYWVPLRELRRFMEEVFVFLGDAHHRLDHA
jgi:hypothetical protein